MKSVKNVVKVLKSIFAVFMIVITMTVIFTACNPKKTDGGKTDNDDATYTVPKEVAEKQAIIDDWFDSKELKIEKINDEGKVISTYIYSNGVFTSATDSDYYFDIKNKIVSYGERNNDKLIVNINNFRTLVDYYEDMFDGNFSFVGDIWIVKNFEKWFERKEKNKFVLAKEKHVDFMIELGILQSGYYDFNDERTWINLMNEDTEISDYYGRIESKKQLEELLLEDLKSKFGDTIDLELAVGVVTIEFKDNVIYYYEDYGNNRYGAYERITLMENGL